MKKALTWIFVVAVVGTAGWFMFGEQLGFSDRVMRDFAIRDTAQVSKLFIADTDGNSITIQRQEDNTWWALKGSAKDYRVRDDAIATILKTISRIEVKQPVAKPALNNVIRSIAGRHSKVEIYTDGEEPEKIWYVGGATKDSQGTFMLLEIPGKGKSKVPFITHVSGNYGYLSSRFFTNAREWRYTGLFNSDVTDISSISVEYPSKPGSSFTIQFAGGNDIELYSDSLGGKVPDYDTTAVKNYMMQYRKVHFESLPQHLSKAKQDSILATPSVFKIFVTYNNGKVRSVQAHRMEANARQDNSQQGELGAPYNVDRLYGFVDGEIFTVIQYFVFDPLLAPLSQFLKD